MSARYVVPEGDPTTVIPAPAWEKPRTFLATCPLCPYRSRPMSHASAQAAARQHSLGNQHRRHLQDHRRKAAA